jgi:hypothetical protein
MPPPEDEPRTWAPREGAMLAGVRNVAWGAAMVMTGLLTLIAVNCVWIVLFRLDTYILFHPCEGCLHQDVWPYTASLVAGSTEGLIGLAVVIWLIGPAIRRAFRSISAHRSFP